MVLDDAYVLPDSVQPVHYDLEIHPDLVTFKFDGKVDITLEVKEPTKKIQLHSKEIHLKTACVKEVPTAKMVSLSFDLVDDIATLTFSEEIPVGKCVLSITYVGEHNNQMTGFYRSSYTGADGTKKTMVSTQLEAIDARRLLPCWDEPAAKAISANLSSQRVSQHSQTCLLKLSYRLKRKHSTRLKRHPR